jgi:hypothetical protein
MSFMDPFSHHHIEKTLSEVVKNLEKRWGLTLVSFLPSEAQEQVREVQNAVAQVWKKLIPDDSCQARACIKFYEPDHFHCTHFTLKRSNPVGQVKAANFLKKGHKMFELFEIIDRVTSRIQPINVRLDRMTLIDSGLGIILVGECEDKESARYRQSLLEDLNRHLPEAFIICKRKMDSKTSQFLKLHCTLGYFKRPMHKKYQQFVENVKNHKFNSAKFRLESVDLVHHRYRSLEFPQEGIVSFPLGSTVKLTENEFARNLNLA